MAITHAVEHDIAVELNPSHWKPLDANCFKINVDASLKEGVHCMGGGIVIRDYKGIVMVASVYRIQSRFSPQIAEAVVTLQGIVFARDMGLVLAVIESDTLGVVNLVNIRKSPFTDIGKYGCPFSC
ncbi:hypothetical protein QYF36_016157 [Acer negundo]|nr:hypothetical protein QYF36_016157 [Acer negundo]